MCASKFCVIRWESVISGIPPGSISGPILFIFYINDLPKVIITKLLLFEDDTKLIKMSLSAMSHSELQNDLNHLISWSEKWQLKFNTSICKVLLFGQTDTKPYTMMNIDIGQMQELKFIDEEKDLGVIIDSKLKFLSHIVKQVKKPNRLMGLYSKIIQISRHSFIKVYVYFSCSPLSWILCYSLISTTKKRWRFDRKPPLPCFQNIIAVIKFNLLKKTCKNWNTEHEISSNAW